VLNAQILCVNLAICIIVTYDSDRDDFMMTH